MCGTKPESVAGRQVRMRRGVPRLVTLLINQYKLKYVYIRLWRIIMKKNEVYTGKVTEYEFPNKGIIYEKKTVKLLLKMHL